MGLVRNIAVRLRQWRKRGSSNAAHLTLGRRGEDTAVRFLKTRGWRILRRNFRPPHGGELDIVCRDDEVLVFVEVKTRASEEHGRPAEAVDTRKRLRIIRGAMAWLRMLDMPEIAFRFDIIEVIGEGKINHIENAFNLPSPYHY